MGGEAAGGVQAAAEGAAAFVVVGLEEELELFLAAGAGFVLLGVEGDEEGKAFAELGGEVFAGSEEGEDAEGALALGGGFIALAGAVQGIGVAVADDDILQDEVGVGGVICDKFTCYPRGFCQVICVCRFLRRGGSGNNAEENAPAHIGPGNNTLRSGTPVCERRGNVLLDEEEAQITEYDRT